MTQQFFLTNCLMRTLLMKKTAGYVATASLIVCPLLSSITVAMPSQSGGIYNTTSTANPVSVKSAKNPVLARNTTAPANPTPTVATVKVPKKEDKKTISRCWKRLMNMAREVHQAHTKKSN